MKRATQTVLIITACCIAGYDLAAYLVSGNDATISNAVLEWSQAWPILPFVFGILCGHLFWPQYLSQEG